MKKNQIIKISFALFLILTIVFVIILLSLLRGCDGGQNEYMVPPVSSAISQEELVDNPINFKYYQEINPEIYAWIRIPNTNIDYPVAQSESDDNFYLHHDIYGKYKFSGTIYTEMQNAKDFTDPNTVLYGHNMTKGYMFQNLYKFQNSEFFDNNKYFYIYTPTHVYTYTVYSAYQYDDRHILNSFNFSDKKVFSDYIESTKNPTFMLKDVREDVEVTAKDKIVTLSTCLGDGKVYRYLVQGVLTNVQKTK